MVFNLNRAYTFENLEHVPYLVLVAIVRTCGKNISLEVAKQKKEDVISFIESYKREISNDFSDLTKDDYLDITTFIGGDGRWTKDTILKAMKNIVHFNRKPVINFNNFHVGYKDSRNLDNYDIIMIYKFCAHVNIKIELNDELEDMLEKVIEYNDKVKGEKQKIEESESRRNEEEHLREEKEREERENKIREQREQREQEEKKEEKEREFEKTKADLRRVESTYRNLETKYNDLKKDFTDKVLETKSEVQDKVKELKSQCDLLMVEKNDLKTKHEMLESKILELRKKESKEITVPDNLSMDNLKIRFFNNFENFEQKQLCQIALLLAEKESIKTTVNKNFNLSNINMNFIVSRSVLTPEEAVIFALKVFSFDLRMSDNKVKHILELNNSRENDTIFQPSNTEGKDYFSMYMQLNKDIFSLDQYWFSDLEDSYSTKASSAIVINQNVENLEELKNIYKTNNFHRGWVPSSKTENIDDQKTFFKNNPVKDLKKHNIFSFGVPWKKVIYFQPEEYIEFLSSKEYPASPFDFVRQDDEDRKTVEKKHIERLRDIGKDYSSNSDYSYLISSLERKMKSMNKSSNTPKRTPVKKAQTPKNDGKSIEMKFLNQYLYNADKYDGILGELFKLGLYIRGWKINNNDFPIKKESVINYKDHQDAINDNVIKTVDRLQELKAATFEILTIVSYDKDRKTFNYEKDLLWEIIDQLKEIKNTLFLDLMSKSNKILVSVYHYNMLATKKKLFEIGDL
jgi:hypothetical protein